MNPPHPFDPPQHLTLTGRHVQLRPLVPQEHAASFHAATHGNAEQEAVWEYMAYGPFPQPADLAAWMEVELRQPPDLLPWAITQQGAVVGMVSLASIAPAHGRAEIGHVVLAKSVQGTLVNTETQYLLLQHLLETHRYRRVEWKCDATNEASRRTALRLGFTYEGRFRQHMLRKGRNRDTDWFSLLDSEWPAARARLKARLEAVDVG